MTAEERAAEAVADWHAENLWGYDPTQHAKLQAHIADAIRASAAEGRERCAKIAEAKAAFHRENCHKSCACADGWHIAMAIRASKEQQ